MPNKFVELHPLDDQGQRSDRPSTEVKWTKLENMIVRDGRLVQRPGLRQFSSLPLDVPTSGSGGVVSNDRTAVAIIEIGQPGSNANSRKQGESGQSIEEPTSTVSNSTWTISGGTLHEALQPGDVDFLSSNTKGDTFEVVMGNASGDTLAEVTGYIVRIYGDGHQAKQEGAFPPSMIKVTDKNGDTIGPGHAGLGAGIYYLPVQLNTAEGGETGQGTLEIFTETDPVNVNVENVSTTVSGQLSLHPQADGAHTAWVNGTGGWDLVNDVWTDKAATTWRLAEPWVPSVTDPFLHSDVAVGGTAVKQSFTVVSDIDSVAGGRAVDTVTYVAFYVTAQKSKDGPANFTLFTRIGGVDYDIVTFEVGGPDSKTYWDEDTGSNVNYYSLHNDIFGGGVSRINPATEVAWTKSDLDSSEWGIKNNEGAIRIWKMVIVPGVVWTAATDLIQIGELTLLCLGKLAGDKHASGTWPGGDRIWFTAQDTDNAGDSLLLDDPSDWVSQQVDVSGALTGGVVSGPQQPIDHAQLFGQAFITSGQEDLIYYPSSGDVTLQLSTKPYGKTIASFADRLLVGWVTDGSNETPERVAYSKRNNGTNWTHVSAGDFDLIQTPGGVVKLLPLTEDVCVAYKETGIYNIRQTGRSIAPLVPDLIDPQTECVARMTVKRVMSPTGQFYHLFLGRTSINGLNVYAYDGNTVQPVGNPIANDIEANAALRSLEYAFAGVDEEAGNYWLFITEEGEAFPRHAWVMDLMSGAWTRAVLPYPVSCAGHWHLQDSDMPDSGFNTTKTGFRKRLVLGKAGGDIKALMHDRWDHVVASVEEDTTHISAYAGIVSTIETGDFELTKEEKQDYLQRVHLYYYDRGLVLLEMSLSDDGGKTFRTATKHAIGTPVADGQLKYIALDVEPLLSRKVRVRIVTQPTQWFNPEDPQTSLFGQEGANLDLAEVVVEFVEGADNP
jgi:hypothetical protein